MRKLLPVLLLAIALTSYSQAPYKYYEVQSGTANDLKDIKLLRTGGTSYFYICGKSGTLLRIANADSLCRPVQSNSTANLNGILSYFGSSYLYPYYIFGDNGILLKSTNSSVVWSEQFSGYTDNIYSGLFLGAYSSISSTRYLAVGENGLIIKRDWLISNDTNWIKLQSGTQNTLKSITTFNLYSEKVWAAGTYGTILRSIDTGNTWTKLISGTNNFLNFIYFKNKDTGLVVGDGGIILKTTNGGNNWNLKTSNTTQNLNCLAYLNDSTIYIAGNKVILFSKNNGENWTIDILTPQYNFYSCKFLYSSYYQQYFPFFAGESGKIFKRTIDTTFHPNMFVKLDGNNINTNFLKYGVFDQSSENYNAGFEWPKGSNKYAVYTAGLCIGAFINGQVHEASASYKGEYSPGYCEHGNYKTSDFFRYYKINRGDNAQTSWDWANWGLMVPYGAPFIDVNNNGIYEPAIDTPGVRNAVQTIFYCMTDAYFANHSSAEGFGGGSRPLGAEVHLTAWVYDTPGLQDVQFINYEIINKSDTNWKRVKIGAFSDPELGDANDDYAGCDTSLKLSFCYNATNNDAVYGLNPPAFGFTLLTSPVNKSVIPNKVFGMTSFNSPYKWGSSCEGQLGYTALKAAYYVLSGYKNDSTCFLDPTQTPYLKTKFTYSGDPETNTGWTRLKGNILNCNLDSTGNLLAPASPADVKMIFASGAEDFNMAPGDTQKFVIAQMIARGTSNLNSVTELKNLTANVRNFYEINFPFVINPVPVVEIPQNFLLGQNYPNPFNAVSHIKFEIPLINGSALNSIHVTLKVYDLLGREIITLVNGEYLPNKYEVSFKGKSIASGMYFYRLTAGDFTAVKRMVLIK